MHHDFVHTQAAATRPRPYSCSRLSSSKGDRPGQWRCEVQCFHSKTRDSRRWISGHLLRCNSDHRADRAAGQMAYLCRADRSDFWSLVYQAGYQSCRPDRTPGTIWLGIGSALQQPSLAAQIVLPIEEVDIGISLTSFAQPLGRVIFMSVSQSLFQNHFMASLPNVQGIDVAKVLAAAAAGHTNAVPAKNLNEALVLCNDGLHRSFLASVAVSCLMSLPAVTMEWRTTKKNNVPVPAVGEDDVSIQRVLGNEPFKCAISHSHLVNIDNVEDGQFVRFGRRPPYSHVSNLLLA